MWNATLLVFSGVDDEAFVETRDVVLLLVAGGMVACVSLWIIARGRFPGSDLEIALRRGEYDGQAFDRRDPRAGAIVVGFFLLAGVGMMVQALRLL